MNDRTIKMLTNVGLAIAFILPSYYYANLPDSIPMHFGFNGLPDAYGSKKTIWLLPIIGLAIYISLRIIGNRNERGLIESKEKSFQHLRKETLGLGMLRALNCFMMWMFAYIVYSIIQVSFGNQAGLGKYFIVVFLLVLFLIIGYYMLNMNKASKD